MSQTVVSPILKAYADLLDTEHALDQAIETARQEERRATDQQRKQYQQEVSYRQAEMRKADELRIQSESQFVHCGLTIPGVRVSAPSSNEGEAFLQRRAALNRVEVAAREIESLRHEYDFELNRRNERVRRLIVTAVFVGIAALIALLWIVDQIQNAARMASAQATSTAISAQATSTAIPNLLIQMRTYGTSYLKRNVDWSPVVQEFDGVPMVLVPPGCFMMGSEEGDSDERPVHQQCFAEPFWIDQTEVTQGQFADFGGRAARPSAYSGSSRPVESITWFEARDFCALRGARLPTEAEWEYAARGPDAWIYPWGNARDANLVVWNRGNSQGTAPVGSIPAGASWVGALDMAGNVLEWTRSLYRSYPYDAADGREADTGNRTDGYRVMRGGSWSSLNAAFLRATYRGQFNPDISNGNRGFRCVRSA
jgi:formylglycine-generating enzyme required for sulfatase activity